MECEVCCEALNKSSRKPIACWSCDIKVCKKCVLKFMQDTPANIRCMGCNNNWSRQHLNSVMTKSFMSKEYRDHRESVLFDQQKSQMEATLPYVECAKRKRERNRELNELYDGLAETHRKIRRVTSAIDDENRFFNNLVPPSSDKPEESTRQFSRGHCVVDTCNGLIDNTWKCSTCETPVCNRCMLQRGPNHVCRTEDVESMRTIRADSKPCPSCGVRIHIYSGCNQAWCTQCNTAFNWRTMKLITSGFFHNPHYAEWEVANGGTGEPVSNFNGRGGAAAAACVTYGDIHRRVLTEFPTLDRHQAEQVSHRMRGFLGAANHILDHNTDRRTEETLVKLRKLRVDYLMNESSEEEFKISTQRVDKAAEKRVELASVFEMYGEVSRDTLAKWARTGEISMSDCEATLENLYSYTKESVKNIHQHYQPFSRNSGSFMNNLYFQL